MKTLIFAIGIVLILGIGALWLRAEPPARQVAAPTVLPLAVTTTGAGIATATPAALPAVRHPVAAMLATHTVGTATATLATIPVGTSTQITVSIQITDPALITSSVNLLRLGAAGTQPTILGVMQSARNGTYSLQHVFTESTTGQVQLQVSAAFTGTLQRVLSNIVTVNVWNQFSDTNTNLSFLFPPMNSSETINSTPGTATTAASLDIAAFDPVINSFVPVLGLTLDTNPDGLTLQQWFEQTVDINGLLLASGAVQQQQLSNGLNAIFITGQIPDQYLMLGGPVSGAYVMSTSGDGVLIIDQPEDANLADLGTSTQDIWALLPKILGTMTFP